MQGDGTKVMIGRAAVYFDRFSAAGTSTGYRFLGNCTPFDLAVTDEVKELYSSVEKTSSLLASVNVKRTIEANAGLYEFTPENIAIGLMGAALDDLVETGADITAEEYTAFPGTFTKVLHRGITDVSVDAGGALTEDTDFTVDQQNGLIHWLPGGAVDDVAGVAVSINYTYATATMKQVAIGASNVINGRLLFVGDPATGPPFEVELWKVAVQPGGTVGLIQDDYANFPLKFKVYTDPTQPTMPYGRAIGLDIAALNA